MKIRVTIKDPDTLGDAVKEAVTDEVNQLKGLDEEERQDLIESRSDKLREEIVEKWVEYGEYYVIEYDTDAGTAVVIPRGE